MNYPKISIVTASYNQGHYIEDTIKSIVEQGYPNLEYIIIDGGSTDNTIEIIKRYEKYIAYWVSEKDRGVCDAINKGFKIATGDIMACINSDDMLHRKSLFTVADIFSSFNNIQWLLGASTIYDEAGRTVEVMQSRDFSPLHFLLGEMHFIQLESCFWTRSLWKEAGGYFDDQLRYASDFDLWIRFFKTERLYITNALIGGFRYRKGNQLSLDNMDTYMNEVKIILERQRWDKKITQNLKKAAYYRRLLRVIRKYKILNNPAITRRISQREEALYNYPQRIRFDRFDQRFKI